MSKSLRWAWGAVLVLAVAADAAATAPGPAAAFASGGRSSSDELRDLVAGAHGYAWALGRRFVAGDRRALLWKIGPDGRPAPGFPVPAGADVFSGDEGALSLAAAADGSIYAVGVAYSRPTIWRFLSDGSLAPGFPRRWGLAFPGLGAHPALRLLLGSVLKRGEYKKEGGLPVGRAVAADVAPDGDVWAAGYEGRDPLDGSGSLAPRVVALWRARPNGTLERGFPRLYDLGGGSGASAVAVKADGDGVWILARRYGLKTERVVLLRVKPDGALAPGFPAVLYTRPADSKDTDPRVRDVMIDEDAVVDRGFRAVRGSASWLCIYGHPRLVRVGADGRQTSTPASAYAGAVAEDGGRTWVVEARLKDVRVRSLDPARADGPVIADWTTGDFDAFLPKAAEPDGAGGLWIGGDLSWGGHSAAAVYRVAP